MQGVLWLLPPISPVLWGLGCSWSLKALGLSGVAQSYDALQGVGPFSVSLTWRDGWRATSGSKRVLSLWWPLEGFDHDDLC